MLPWSTKLETLEQTTQADALRSPLTVIEPPRGWWRINFRELWEFRELLYFLSWRDILLRYKQTVLGVLWAVLQPLLTMVVFSVIFGGFAKLPSSGIPYPLFTYAALLPWQFFSRAVADTATSLVSNQQLVTKIYFPRFFLPVAPILSGLVDFVIAFVILLGMMWYFHQPILINIFVLPVLVFATMLISLAVGLWLSALNVKYRDVRYIVPFLTQAWLFVTPVAYASKIVPEQFRAIYGLNPMAGVVDGFRWALFGQQTASGALLPASAAATVVLLVGGLIYFHRLESEFSDII